MTLAARHSLRQRGWTQRIVPLQRHGAKSRPSSSPQKHTRHIFSSSSSSSAGAGAAPSRTDGNARSHALAMAARPSWVAEPEPVRVAAGAAARGGWVAAAAEAAVAAVEPLAVAAGAGAGAEPLAVAAVAAGAARSVRGFVNQPSSTLLTAGGAGVGAGATQAITTVGTSARPAASSVSSS